MIIRIATGISHPAGKLWRQGSEIINKIRDQLMTLPLDLVRRSGQSIYNLRVEHNEKDDYDKNYNSCYYICYQKEMLARGSERGKNHLRMFFLWNITLGCKYFLRPAIEKEFPAKASCSDGVGEGVRFNERISSE